MELDLARWRNLIGEIAALRAQGRGIYSTVFSLRAERDKALVGMMHLEEQHARSSHLPRDIGGAMDQALAAARAQVAALDAEISDLEARQAVLTGRAGRLDLVERACRAWARSAGLVLPDDDAGLPTAAVRGTSGPAREFVGQVAVGRPPDTGNTPPPPAALGRSPSRFGMTAAADLSLPSRVFNALGIGALR